MKYTIVLLGLLLTAPFAFVHAEYTDSSKSNDESTYWEQKKLESLKKNSEMRKSYYEKYLSKGYDMSSITSDLLDASKTDEGKFWDALKKIQNTFEMADRKSYVEKYRSKGMDVSMFTDDVMNDSGKFWDLIKKIQQTYEEKQKEAYQKEKDSKGDSSLSMKQDTNQNVNTTTTKTNTQYVLVERAKKLFIERLNKIDGANKEATYSKLQTNIEKQLELAKNKKNKLLIMKLEMMKTVLKERMEEEEMDDDTLLNSIF